MQQKTALRWFTRVAFLGAAAAVLMVAIETPILPAAPYLKWDPGDIPAMVAAFAMGPVAGAAVEVVKIVLWQLTGKNTTGPVGFAANLLAGLTLVVSAGLVYRSWRTRAGAIAAMAAGTLAMTAVMVLANALVFFPLWGIKGPAVTKALVEAAVPFNVLKGILTSTITFVVYKKVRQYLDGR